MAVICAIMAAQQWRVAVDVSSRKYWIYIIWHVVCNLKNRMKK
jgi:hypothetical protein